MLVSGPGAYICDACIAAFAEIVYGIKPQGVVRMQEVQQPTDEELLALLPKVSSAIAQPERQLALLVHMARARGITWARIGAALGMTRQSAWERFSGEA
jgi:ClpX C4-type zinc finger